MTWNLSFSLVTAVMLCILLGYYALSPRLPIVLNRFFVSLAVLEMLTLASDVISTWMDMNHQDFPIWLLTAVNMVYFLLYVTRSYATYAYTISLVGTRKKMPAFYKMGGWILVSVFWLVMLSSLFTGAVFTIDQEGYHSGPLYPVLYVQMFVFLILGLQVLIHFRTKIHDTAFYGILVSYAILIAGGFFRFAFSHFLLMDTFYMLAIMILYLTIHNVDLNRESRTMLFDFQAFEQVVREHQNFGIRYYLIGFMNRNYKETRQIYGGRQMDKVLSQIGKFLRETFRSSTVYYERSGCFLVMIEEKHVQKQAVSELLAKAARRLNEPWDTEEARVYLHFVNGQMGPDLKIYSVDQELEAIRNILEKGANGEIDRDFVVDQRTIERILREFTVKKALSDAIQEDALMVYLQPIVEASTGRIVGAEALSRMQDPGLGIIPPGEFIPLAERSGSIMQIGKQVLAKTCRFLRDHGKDLPGLEFININLSPIQCMDHELAETFRKVPQTYGVDPVRLHLEITEESMVDPEVLRGQMELLGQYGYTFALDDYGCGYANQFRIKAYPFSGIKLDMNTVWAHFKDPDTILPNTVKAFLGRGLTVTAEGVETEEMARQLTEMGCTYLQGYYFSKPVPMDVFIEYVKRNEAMDPVHMDVSDRS